MASPKDKHFNVEAYLKSMEESPPINFFGIEVPVPTDTPLSYTLKAQEIQDSSAEDPRNILKLLGDVLGKKIAEQIEEVDPGIRAIGALLLWAFKNASGDEISFEDAYTQYLEQEKESREEAKNEDEGEEGKAKPKGNLKAVPSGNGSGKRPAPARQSGKKSAKTSR